jgi:hypothetical protein
LVNLEGADPKDVETIQLSHIYSLVRQAIDNNNNNNNQLPSENMFVGPEVLWSSSNEQRRVEKCTRALFPISALWRIASQKFDSPIMWLFALSMLAAGANNTVFQLCSNAGLVPSLELIRQWSIRRKLYRDKRVFDTNDNWIHIFDNIDYIRGKSTQRVGETSYNVHGTVHVVVRSNQPNHSLSLTPFTISMSPDRDHVILDAIIYPIKIRHVVNELINPRMINIGSSHYRQRTLWSNSSYASHHKQFHLSRDERPSTSRSANPHLYKRAYYELLQVLDTPCSGPDGVGIMIDKMRNMFGNHRLVEFVAAVGLS